MSSIEEEIIVTDEEWTEFKNKHKKSYKDVNDETQHRITYLANKKVAHLHNKRFENGEVSFKMGINQFTDMTSEEQAKYRGGHAGDSKK